MSHHIGFFAHKEGITADEVRAAYQACIKGLPFDWPGGGELSKFIHALESRYPETITSETASDYESPWTASALKTEGCFIVHMAMHAADEVGSYIWELQQQYYLVVYDPQSDRAYVGIEELPGTSTGRKWWKLWA